MSVENVTLLEALDDLTSGNTKIPQSDFLATGSLAIVDQGRGLIAGWTDDHALRARVDGPVIIFGDHTRAMKYIDFPFALGADGVKVLRARPGFDTMYVFHYLRSCSIPSAGYSRHFKFLKELRVPQPAIEEQRRIAAILDQADAIRTKRRQILAHLDTLTQSTFYAMFGEPMVPGRYAMRALGSLARIIRGASPRPAGDPRYFGGSIPWLKIRDLSAARGSTVRRIQESVTEAGRERSVHLPAGTLVLTNSATVGIPKIIEPATCIHDGFLAFLNLNDGVDQTWLWAALDVSRPRIVALAPEGTQKNLNGPIVKAIEFGIPPLSVQREFAARLATIMKSRGRVERALAADDELFESLQSRAFRGEL